VPPSEQDRERIADEQYTDRLITVSLYCSRCGYDLYRLPYIHECPECGQEYNARPLSMKGIFMPYQAEFPVRELAVAAVCGFGAMIMLGSGWNPPDIWRLLFGVTLGACFVMEVQSGWQKILEFRRARAIMRKIKRDRS